MDKHVLFSVHRYDSDGDVYEEGIFLHFGEVGVKVANDINDFDNFIGDLQKMKDEIKEKY